MGRVPLPGLQGRRRGRAGQPQHQAADPLLPRGRRRRCGSSCPTGCVLDGEIFVALRGDDGVDRLEFETLQERIHPAKSRIDMLAEKTPAGFVAFDLLALGDTSYVDRPFAERRAALEEALGGLDGPCFLTQTTTDPARGRGVVPPVRGRRARRRGRQAAGRAVRRERPHDAQDQARAHRRRRRRGLPRAQDQHPRAAAARQPAARPVRRDGRAAAHRRQRQLHRGPAGRADRAAPAARRPDRGAPVGPLGGVPDRQPRPGARAPRAAGARARTSASRRCGPTW